MALKIEILIEALKIVAAVAVFFVWVVRYDNIKKEFKKFGFPSWFRDMVGILKISFTFMLHSANNETILLGSIGIVSLMIGAILTHVKIKKSNNGNVPCDINAIYRSSNIIF